MAFAVYPGLGSICCGSELRHHPASRANAGWCPYALPMSTMHSYATVPTHEHSTTLVRHWLTPRMVALSYNTHVETASLNQQITLAFKSNCLLLQKLDLLLTCCSILGSVGTCPSSRIVQSSRLCFWYRAFACV